MASADQTSLRTHAKLRCHVLAAAATISARRTIRKSRASLLRIERETLVGLERARDAGGIGQAKNWVEDQERVLCTARGAGYRRRPDADRR